MVQLRRSMAFLLLFACASASNSAFAQVSITSPSNGATVSGTVSVVTTISSGVVWVDLDVDAKFYAVSPPLTFSWDSTTVGNGPHTLTAFAFDKSGAQVGITSIGVTVNNTASGGTSYYVASYASGGRDTNSGTSPSSPWLSLNRVNTANLQPGDTVYFQSGTMWRGTLQPPRGGLPGAPITFTSYGSGSQPTISGADVVSGWTLDSGSIYSAPLTKPAGNVWSNGGPPWGLVAASSVSAMTAGTRFWDSASQRLYVWLQDGGNPSTRTIEAATRVYGYETNSGVCSDFSYITINGLKFQRSSGFGIYFHCYAGPAPLSGIVIENNTVSQTGTGQVDGGQYYNGIMFLQSPAYLNAAPQILNNTTSYTGGHGNGINLQGANNALISGNNVSQWNHNGIDVKYADGVTVSGNTVHDRLVSGAGLYLEQSQGSLENNFVYNAKNGFQIGVGSSAAVYNNSIYNSPTGIYYGPTGTSLTVKNNAVNGSSTSFGTDGSPNLVEDYNDWGVKPTLSIGSSRYSFAQWLTLGSHAHDMAADPAWTAPPSNFNLTQLSPCINAGTQVGLPYSGSAPDLGAIESSW